MKDDKDRIRSRPVNAKAAQRNGGVAPRGSAEARGRLALYWALSAGASLALAACVFIGLEALTRVIWGTDLKDIPPIFTQTFPINDKHLFAGKSSGLFESNSDLFEVNREVVRFGVPTAIRTQRFRMPKPRGLYRIFCVGESSVVGCCPCPTPIETSFPYKLEKYLQGMGYDVEVINAGIAAVTSFRLLKLVEELAHYEPDAVILYAGHNEYGYYFWDESVLRSHGLLLKIKVDQWLMHSYVYRLLKRQFNRQAKSQKEWLKYRVKTDKAEDIQRLYKDLIPTEEWADFAQKELFLCENQFESNVAKMAATLDRAGIKFVVCTLVSNIKGVPPVYSSHRPNLTPDELKEFQARSAMAEGLLGKRDYARAVPALQELLKMDPYYAQTCYWLGQADYGLERYDAARKYFILARDLAPAYAPFQRAPSSLNNRIRKLASKYGFLMIDLEKEFYALKDNFGIPGDDLFLDTLHPNEECNALIAQFIAGAMQTLRLPSKNPARPAQARQGAEASWSQADSAATHDKLLADALLAQGQVEAAIAHYREALRIKPNDARAQFNLGRALAQEGRVDEAVSQYRETLRIDPKHVGALNNLGNIFFRQGRLREAAAQYQEVLRLMPDYAPEIVDVHVNLGLALAGEGRLSEAAAQYREALRLKPDSAKARFDLGMALAGQGKLEEAAAQYRELLMSNPGFEPARKNLEILRKKSGKP